VLHTPRGCKLSDFGIAALLGHTAVAGCAGTPTTMAPEQFDDPGGVGPWSDLYGVGCTAWALATGRTPFADAVGMEGQRHAHRTWPLPRLAPRTAVPAELEDWLAALLAKHPADRPRCAADAVAALLQLGGPPLAPVAAPGEKERPTQTVTADRQPAPEVGLVGVAHRAAQQTPAMAPTPLDATWPPPPRANPFRGAIGISLFGLRPLPLVGRNAQRDALWEALGRAHRGEGPAAVWVGGAAGVGKSALARWLCRTAAEAGAAVALEVLHGDLPAALERGLPVGGWRMAQTGFPELALRAADPANRHAHLVELLHRIGEDRATVLWIDDVIAQPELLDQVARLLVQSRPSRTLVLLTARTEDLPEHPDAARELDALVASGLLTSIQLGPLGPSERVSFVRQMLGLEGELAARVEARTQGNPLFAVQLVGDWVLRGQLVPSAGGYTAPGGAEPTLPAGLREVWSARVERALAPDLAQATPALEAAAVLGLTVDQTVWSAVVEELGLPPIGPLRARLLANRLLEPAPGGVSFVHGMLREAIVAGAADAGRAQATHRAAARVLSRMGEQEEAVGTHLLAAGRSDEAAAPLIRGLSHRIAHGELAAAEVVARAASRAVTHPADVARLALQLARLARLRGRAEESRAHLERLASLPHSDPELDADAAVEAVLTAYRAGDLDRVVRDAAAAAEGAQQRPHTQAACLEALARAESDLGHHDEAGRCFEQARALYGTVDDEEGQATCTLGLAMVAVAHGDLQTAAAHAGQAVASLDALGAPIPAATARNIVGEVARRRGDLQTAERAYREAVTRHRAAGSATGERNALLNLGIVLLERGEPAAAAEVVQPVAAALSVDGTHLFLGPARLVLAAEAAHRGDIRAWRTHWTAAQKHLDSTGLVHSDVAVLALHSAVALDAAQADEAAAQARRLAQRHSV
jgi:tetratricopeptide (TPR) repeat protein